jgi:hypothetical protein
MFHKLLLLTLAQRDIDLIRERYRLAEVIQRRLAQENSASDE